MVIPVTVSAPYRRSPTPTGKTILTSDSHESHLCGEFVPERLLEPLLDHGAEALVVVTDALGTPALSLLGLAAEYNAFQQLLGGDSLLAVWLILMGGVGLAFAAKLAREKLVPCVRPDG